VTEAEIIRRSLDRGLAEIGSPRPDPAAWVRVQQYVKARRMKRVGGPRPRWTREELHAR